MSKMRPSVSDSSLGRERMPQEGARGKECRRREHECHRTQEREESERSEEQDQEGKGINEYIQRNLSKIWPRLQVRSGQDQVKCRSISFLPIGYENGLAGLGARPGL